MVTMDDNTENDLRIDETTWRIRGRRRAICCIIGILVLISGTLWLRWKDPPNQKYSQNRQQCVSKAEAIVTAAIFALSQQERAQDDREEWKWESKRSGDPLEIEVIRLIDSRVGVYATNASDEHPWKEWYDFTMVGSGDY